MKFIEVHQSHSLRYAFYEADSNSKNNSISFQKDHQYVWHYKLVSHFPKSRILKILGTNITFGDNKTEILIPKSSRLKRETLFNIIFTPQIDKKFTNINLSVIKSFREPEIILIKGKFPKNYNKNEIRIEGRS